MKIRLEKIILVDDDAISNYVTEELIREKDLCNEIVTLTDGMQAIDYLQHMLQAKASGLQPILVLLDLNMPVMDGFEFMEELEARALHQQVVVAILTSSDNHKDVAQATNYPFAAYLQKPVSPDSINALIANYFHN